MNPKVLPFLFLALLSFGMLKAQVPSTGATGAFQAGERDISFTNSSLATPNVAAKAFYPATVSGNNQPFASGQFPIIAFGHGFNLNFLDYQIMCKHLASWGYIVVTPDVQNGFSVDHLEFARQLGACLDYILAEGSNNSSPFYQHTDTMTGVVGHSMGGGASALVHTVYPNIDAVSGLAAAETNPSAIAALATYSGPFQSISGSADNTAPESSNQVPMYNAATGAKQHVSITGGAHCKFTDGSTICDFVSSAGSITRTFQIYLANKYATAFFNYYLKNDLDALPFLCGDSLQADISVGNISGSNNIACATSINETKDAPLKAWPLPANHAIHFQSQGWTSLIDLHGKVLLRAYFEVGETGSLDLGTIAPGLYLLKSGDQLTRIAVQ